MINLCDGTQAQVVDRLFEECGKDVISKELTVTFKPIIYKYVVALAERECVRVDAVIELAMGKYLMTLERFNKLPDIGKVEGEEFPVDEDRGFE